MQGAISNNRESRNKRVALAKRQAGNGKIAMRTHTIAARTTWQTRIGARTQNETYTDAAGD